MSETTDEAYGKATRRLWRLFKKGKLTAEEYKRESIASFEQWKGAQQAIHEQEARITVQHTAEGWSIQLDNQSWVTLITALEIAIEHSDQEQADTYRRLRTALSQMEPQ
jgi:hypothetical protein